VRVLILSQSLGVYIGSCIGLGFWSKIENLDMPDADGYSSEEECVAAGAERWNLCANELLNT
jgi:hypothetical protein